jgi:hypothetical protein
MDLQAEIGPALLVAPTSRSHTQTDEIDEAEGAGLGQFQVIATGWSPEVESALLMDLLERSLASPAEAPNCHAVVNAYKHRLHALRGEYADARQRATEAEEQLAEARLRILRLEARVKHLDTTLQQIHASRWWKVKERCAHCWRIVARWLRRIGPCEQPPPLPDEVRR